MDSSLLVPYDTRRQLSLVSRPSFPLSLAPRLLSPVCCLLAVIRSRFCKCCFLSLLLLLPLLLVLAVLLLSTAFGSV